MVMALPIHNYLHSMMDWILHSFTVTFAKFCYSTISTRVEVLSHAWRARTIVLLKDLLRAESSAISSLS
jgi:hypothetical protein